MFLDKEQMNSMFMELGLVSQEDFAVAEIEALEKGLTINNILIRKGIIGEDEVKKIQSKVSNVDFIDLKNLDIKEDILLSIPEPISRKYNIISFGRDENILKVAVLDLEVLDKINFLKKQVALKVIPYLTDKTSIKQNLLRYQDLLKDEYGTTIQKEFLAFQTISEGLLKDLSREEVLDLARDKKINYVFELFLKHALLQKASNVHIEPQQDKTLIKYRIGGKLYSTMVLPKNASIILNLKINALIGQQYEKKVDNFSIGINGKEVTFQVNKIESLWGERIVLNILRLGDSGFSLESLGFYGRALDILYSEITKKKKIILIAGDKKSGKTTTFYTFLDFINDLNLAIGTIENSLGFQISGISQTITNPDIGFGISQGIEKLNKQNLDVLGVDEIENSQDLKILFKSYWEDRFAFAVLESQKNSGVEIIFNLKSLKINPVVIVANLGTIILQKSVTELSNTKREEYYLSVEEIKKISKKEDIDMEKVMKVLIEEGILKTQKPWSEITFYKSSEKSKEKKIIITEVFKISSVIKEMILNNSSKKEIEIQASKEGMMTMSEDLLFKAVQGLVSIEELI